MTALALPQPGLWLPKRFEPWRLLKPLLKIDGQWKPNQLLQFEEDQWSPSVADAAADATIVYRDSAVFTDGDQGVPTSTWAGRAIGPAAADRHVLVGASVWVDTAPTGVSVDGPTAAPIALSLVHKTTATGGEFASSLWIGLVPNDATADIILSGMGTARSGIVVWSATSLNSATATAVYGSTAGPGAATMVISAGGFGVAMATSGDVNTADHTWAGLTLNAIVVGPNTRKYSGASANFAVAQAGLSVTATYPTSHATTRCAAFASFR